MSAVAIFPVRMGIPVGLVLFFGLFYVGILGSLAGVGWAAWRSHTAASWPVVRGEVRDLSVRQSKKDQSLSLTVRYAYSVDGVEYVGTRIAFGFSGRTKETVARIYKRLKRSTSVEVRYNPAKPSQCCLTYGWHTEFRFQLIFQVMVLAFITGVVLIVATATRGDGGLVESVLVN